MRGDFLGAVDLYEVAALEAGQIGALALESGWQTGALWALSNVTDDDTAPDRFRKVLRAARAQRDWPNLWTALELLAFYWAANGHLEPAGILLGHLDSTNHRVADIADRREQAAATVEASPEAQRRASIGATMSQDELVRYAVDQLQTSADVDEPVEGLGRV